MKFVTGPHCYSSVMLEKALSGTSATSFHNKSKQPPAVTVQCETIHLIVKQKFTQSVLLHLLFKLPQDCTILSQN